MAICLSAFCKLMLPYYTFYLCPHNSETITEIMFELIEDNKHNCNWPCSVHTKINITMLFPQQKLIYKVWCTSNQVKNWRLGSFYICVIKRLQRNIQINDSSVLSNCSTLFLLWSDFISSFKTTCLLFHWKENPFETMNQGKDWHHVPHLHLHTPNSHHQHHHSM